MGIIEKDKNQRGKKYEEKRGQIRKRQTHVHIVHGFFNPIFSVYFSLIKYFGGIGEKTFRSYQFSLLSSFQPNSHKHHFLTLFFPPFSIPLKSLLPNGPKRVQREERGGKGRGILPIFWMFLDILKIN